MTAIEVTQTDTPRVFDVRIEEVEGRATRHRVTVPSDPASARLPDTDPEHLVHESITFLLEREPATAILGEFDLTLISEYFPEYPAEITRRVVEGP